jgi:hypothetical protein
MLMFADDISIIIDTVGRLQQHLRSLHEFCIKYGLSVNINKTKVMVFRNGGVLRQKERWYFNNELLESVTCYKYLGIVFSSKLSWSKALETLASQAAKATYMIRFINRECNHLPVSLQFDLFDTK